MNNKGVVVIIGVAIIISLVIFLPLKPGDVPPIIGGNIQVEDNAQVGLQIGTDPSTQFKDDALITIEGANYFVDENGTKHYVLEAIDILILED